jgi:hypothetical protein
MATAAQAEGSALVIGALLELVAEAPARGDSEEGEESHGSGCT